MDLSKVKTSLYSAILGYGGALFFSFLALGITLFLWWSLVRSPGAPLFLGAIALSAWLFGLRSGIFASIVSGILIDYFLVNPIHEFHSIKEDLLRVFVFSAEGTFLSWLVSTRKITSKKIKESQQQLSALSLHQQTLREAEQKRISLEIHDELGQSLTGLKMDIHWLKRQINLPDKNISTEIITEKLNELSNLVDTTITSVRRIATELRPSILDDFGLVAAIEWQAREFERKTNIPCTVLSNMEDFNLSTEIATAVFRIFQESLTNIARHAKAASVRVSLQAIDGQVLMRIEDSGKGINLGKIKNTNSLGLLGMKERSRLIGGTLNIFKGYSGGTVVELIFPLVSNDSD